MNTHETELNYMEDIIIDESSLDVEWLRQPQLTFTYNKELAKLRRRMDMAKERIDVVKAELDSKIRTKPEKFGIDKVTEAAINNTITAHTDYKSARMDFLNAKYDVDMCQAACWAFQERKAALENLVKLHGQNYFAGPSVPRNLNKEWVDSEKQKMANKKVVIKQPTKKEAEDTDEFSFKRTTRTK